MKFTGTSNQISIPASDAFITTKAGVLKPCYCTPPVAFLRLPQIIGNSKATPPIPALIPISKSSWWDGIKKGIYPEAVKIGPRTTAWRVEDIHELINNLGGK